MNDLPIFLKLRGLKRRWSGKARATLTQDEVDEFNAALLEARTASPSAQGPLTADKPQSSKLGHPDGPQGIYDRSLLVAELRRDEGERLKAYRDTVGKWTIGIGRNLDDAGTAPLGRSVDDVKAKGITAQESAVMLGHDIDRVEADLDRKLPWWRSLDPVRQRVLVNMAFNLGIGGLLGFTNTLGMIEGHRFTGAAANMLKSKWAGQVGARAQRLSAMMREGKA